MEIKVRSVIPKFGQRSLQGARAAPAAAGAMAGVADRDALTLKFLRKRRDAGLPMTAAQTQFLAQHDEPAAPQVSGPSPALPPRSCAAMCVARRYEAEPVRAGGALSGCEEGGTGAGAVAAGQPCWEQTGRGGRRRAARQGPRRGLRRPALEEGAAGRGRCPAPAAAFEWCDAASRRSRRGSRRGGASRHQRRARRRLRRRARRRLRWRARRRRRWPRRAPSRARSRRTGSATCRRWPPRPQRRRATARAARGGRFPRAGGSRGVKKGRAPAGPRGT